MSILPPPTDKTNPPDANRSDVTVMLTDPRVGIDRYVVRPSCYADMVNSDRDMWCLEVVNGHAWGWSVRRAGFDSGFAMNRKGEWIYERRGSGHNKARRWPPGEALRIALKYVDTHRINGHTAAEATANVAARLAAARGVSE